MTLREDLSGSLIIPVDHDRRFHIRFPISETEVFTIMMKSQHLMVMVFQRVVIKGIFRA